MTSETMEGILSHASQRITLRFFKRYISKRSQINTYKPCANHGTCMEVKGQLSRVGSLLPPCGTQGLKEGWFLAKQAPHHLTRLAA